MGLQIGTEHGNMGEYRSMTAILEIVDKYTVDHENIDLETESIIMG